MRLGASYRPPHDDPDELAHAYAASGYSAAVCPKLSLAETDRLRATRAAFARHDILIAEVGVWNNMLDPDPAKRSANVQANCDALALAEEVGARCCVNIAGSFHPSNWAGPHTNNLATEAFALTVQNVRQIVEQSLSATTEPPAGRRPLIIERLPPAEYPAARDYITSVAASIGLAFHSHGSANGGAVT